MGRSAQNLSAAHKLGLLLCGATMVCAVAGDVVTYSIPAFNAATEDNYYIALTNNTILLGSMFIFGPLANPEFNTSGGFLLLSNEVEFWRAGTGGGVPVVEPSFSFDTSFTLLAGAAPVSFVVRGGSTNIVNPPRGPAPANATGSLASVEVRGVRSFCPSCFPDYGLNVTVSPTGAAPGDLAVWVEHRAAEHRLSVYVAGAGDSRPPNDLLTVPLGIDGPLTMHWTTATAPVGFFAAMVRDVIDGVRDWTLTVELPESTDNSRRSNLAAILSSVLGSAAAIAIASTAVYFYFNSKYRRWKNEQDKLNRIMQGLPGVPTKVEFTDIKRATKNFHEMMKLGKGGFGAVYRCTIPASASRTGHATEVAVKKFTQEVEDRRYDDFLAEVSIINRLRHKNIVPLVGWSYNKGVPILVYEYMTNGSLDQHLFPGGGNNKHRHDQMDAAISQWATRYSIVRDVATGLHYVHHEHEPVVLHRDIKASNIMLDSAFRARLGDFGIACTVAANKSYVTGIAGTLGYIGPDYAMSRKATRQTDIYAFGVLVLEVVTGKKNSDVLPDDDDITDWVWGLHRQGMLLEAVDSILTAGDMKEQNGDEANRLLLLGLACTNPNPSNRPSTVEVVQIINKLAPTPEVPLERPAFVWPPEDWRTRNSMYSTAMSDWESSTMELVQFSQRS